METRRDEMMGTVYCTYLNGDAGTVGAGPGIEGTECTVRIAAALELGVLPPEGGGGIFGVIPDGKRAARHYTADELGCVRNH